MFIRNISIKIVINSLYKAIIESIYIIIFYAIFVVFYVFFVNKNPNTNYSYDRLSSMIYTIPLIILISIIIITIRKYRNYIKLNSQR